MATPSPSRCTAPELRRRSILFGLQASARGRDHAGRADTADDARRAMQIILDRRILDSDSLDAMSVEALGLARTAGQALADMRAAPTPSSRERA
jgi:hypothetical protein